MGYRVISVKVNADPAVQLATFLRQFAAFARFHGASVLVKKPKEYPGNWVITIEGNSSFLNELTPDLIKTAAAIATDINPNNDNLRIAAADISSQLSDQVVDWNGVPVITSARPGRELAARLSGEASFMHLKDELCIHDKRIRGQLSKYHNVKGATAWRQRHKLNLLLRVDCLALVATARRLHRITDDLYQRLPKPTS